MRLTSKAAVVGLAAAASLGLAASAADAAASHKWSAPHSFANEWANGTYTHTKSLTVVKGRLGDTKRDGWTACVQFKFTRAGYYPLYNTHYIGSKNGPADGSFTIVLNTTKVKGAQHLYVRECRIKTKHPKTIQYGGFKHLF